MTGTIEEIGSSSSHSVEWYPSRVKKKVITTKNKSPVAGASEFV